MGDAAAETLAWYGLGREEVRRALRITNTVGQYQEELRRRTWVIRVFTHEASLQRLLTALAIEANDRWRVQRWLIAPPSSGRSP